MDPMGMTFWKSRSILNLSIKKTSAVARRWSLRPARRSADSHLPSLLGPGLFCPPFLWFLTVRTNILLGEIYRSQFFVVMSPKFYSYGHGYITTDYFHRIIQYYTIYKWGFVSTYNWYNLGLNCRGPISQLSSNRWLYQKTYVCRPSPAAHPQAVGLVLRRRFP